MAEKKSIFAKAVEVAKKAVAKPAAKKAVAKPAAKKAVAKKAVAKKAVAKPAAKKAVASGNKTFKKYSAKANESYMSKNQMKHFKDILADWKKELSHDIDKTVSNMQDELTAYADPNDRASQESDMALELRNRDRERKLIKKIEQTIRNIDNDDYGYCEQCGEEIGLNRLQARPTATLCIDCKTLDEIREKQMAK
jgi:DnaK suppressor protein